MNTVYAVIFDGVPRSDHDSSVWCELHCAGIFSTIEKAKKKSREITAYEVNDCKIIEFELDKPLSVTDNGNYLESDCRLTGYFYTD